MKKLIHRIAAVVLSMAVVSTLGNSILRADEIEVNETDDYIYLECGENGSGTYTLEEDLTKPIKIFAIDNKNADITIDLNGHNIHTDETAIQLFNIQGGIGGCALNSLTITGPGKVTSENGYSINHFHASASITTRELIINGGEYGKISNVTNVTKISNATIDYLLTAELQATNSTINFFAAGQSCTITNCKIANGFFYSLSTSDASTVTDTDFMGYEIEYNEYLQKHAEEFKPITFTNANEQLSYWKVYSCTDHAADDYLGDLYTKDTGKLTVADIGAWYEENEPETRKFYLVPVWESVTTDSGDDDSTTDTSTTTTTTTTTEPAAPIHVPDAYDFVERLYHIALGRGSEEAGRNYWLGALNNGEKSGSEVAYGFFFSPEFIGSDYSNEEYVESLYNAILGRYSDPEGLANWVNALNNGMTREEVFNGFVTSPEFSELCSSYGVKS